MQDFLWRLRVCWGGNIGTTSLGERDPPPLGQPNTVHPSLLRHVWQGLDMLGSVGDKKESQHDAFDSGISAQSKTRSPHP